MKRLFTIFLVTNFIGVAVFGVFGMQEKSDIREHAITPSSCIAATAKGMDCPKNAEPLAFLNFHLDAFRSFSTATFGADLLASLLVLTLLVIALGAGALSLTIVHAPLPWIYSRYRWREFFHAPFSQQLLSWLALHENSPAFA